MSDNTAPEKTRRIRILDTLRGLAIIYMLFYHTVFDLAEMFGVEWAEAVLRSQDGISIWFTGTFVLLGGVTIRFSRDPAIHGARLLIISAVFSLVTAFFFPGCGIYFGVLHLFSIGMLFYAVFRKQLERIPMILGICACLLLFIFTLHTQKGVWGFDGLFTLPVPEALTQNNYLYSFGFLKNSFSTVDYLPVFPWIFLFLIGCFAGRLLTMAKDKSLPDAFYRDYCPPITWLGKHSLVIYVVHQPIVYAVLFIVIKIIR